MVTAESPERQSVVQQNPDRVRIYTVGAGGDPISLRKRLTLLHRLLRVRETSLSEESVTPNPVVREILGRPRIRRAVFAGNHTLLWTRLTQLYRLCVRAKEASWNVESVSPARQRERALWAFWHDGGDLGY